MHIQRNIEARSRNHCCHWRAISKTYFECVFVALVYGVYAIIYGLLWPVCLYHIFPYYLINGTIFGEGGGRGIIEHKMSSLISLQFFFFRNISHSKNN